MDNNWGDPETERISNPFTVNSEGQAWGASEGYGYQPQPRQADAADRALRWMWKAIKLTGVAIVLLLVVGVLTAVVVGFCMGLYQGITG